MELGVNNESGVNMKNIVVHPKGEHTMNNSACRLARTLGIDNESQWLEWDSQFAVRGALS